MALSLTGTLTQSSDCSIFTIMDTTGAYSSGNLGGWGAPNSDVTDVTTVGIYGTFRPAPSSAPAVLIGSAISPIGLMPTTQYPLPYALWQQFQLTPALLGFSGDTFDDGVYTLTIEVDTGITKHVINIQQLVTCNADCCIGKKLAKIDPFDSANGDALDALYFNFMTLQGAKASAGCGQNNSALDALAVVETYCDGCGCGCN